MDKKRDWRKLLGFSYSCFIVVSLICLFVMTGKDLGQTDPNSKIYADFVGYYRSGKMVLSEDRNKIYDREIQLKYFNELGAAQQSDQFIYSQNPPFFFLMLAPFASIPLSISFKIWIALSIVLPATAIHFLMKELHQTKWNTNMIFVLAALLSVPGWICVFVGQMSWFVALFFTLFCLGFIKKNDVLTGIALSLITSKFQYVFVLGIPVLASRRWRAIAWAAGTELILLAVSALILGPENVITYPKLLFSAETTKDYIGVFPEHMISLRGVLSLFLNTHQALVISSLLMFAGLIPLFIFWFKTSRNEAAENSAWALSITICAALLLSAHTHIYDDVLLLVVAALTLPFFWKSIEYKGAAGTVWQTILYAFPAASWVIFIVCGNVELIKRTPFALINLILVIAGLMIWTRVVGRNLVPPI